MVDNPNPTPAPKPVPEWRPGGPQPTPTGPAMNVQDLYHHLLLSKELLGHPHLVHLKALNDAALAKANAAAKVEAEKMAADINAKLAADKAKADHDAAVLAAAADARRRLAEAEALKVQPADQKVVSEADAIAKARADEAMRQHREAFPAPAHVPPPAPMPPKPPETP